MSGRPFERPKKFKNRMCMMLIGILLQGMGLSMLIRLNLGTDPCSCFTLGVQNRLPEGVLSFGTLQLICNLVMFLFVIKNDLSMIGFGTIGNMVCLGYISDFFTWVWSKVLPGGLGFFDNRTTCYILLIPVLAVFIFGAATYMTAGLGMSPYDGLPFIIASKQKKFSFKVVRMIWDISFMILGFILGGTFGAVTIASAFFIGPVIAFIQKKLSVFIE